MGLQAEMAALSFAVVTPSLLSLSSSETAWWIFLFLFLFLSRLSQYRHALWIMCICSCMKGCATTRLVVRNCVVDQVLISSITIRHALG